MLREPLTTKLLSLKLRSQLYRTLIIPVMTYGNETWAITSNELDRLETTHNNMCRAVTRTPARLNDGVYCVGSATQARAAAHVPTIAQYTETARLRLLGQMARAKGELLANIDTPVTAPRTRGIPRPSWHEMVKIDMAHKNVTIEDAKNKNLWKTKTTFPR